MFFVLPLFSVLHQIVNAAHRSSSDRSSSIQSTGVLRSIDQIGAPTSAFFLCSPLQFFLCSLFPLFSVLSRSSSSSGLVPSLEEEEKRRNVIVELKQCLLNEKPLKIRRSS
ncbi:hypothetical protein CMV_025677 [Castanea mollissima]|uniref:Uncharacterized protein n=1 Tax=Castanea mollissima TaxID=60419 RepID=A0A8J4QP06_9ROSI|nr:hypothetical protein CMV_025677 [Castanea mollissima]